MQPSPSGDRIILTLTVELSHLTAIAPCEDAVFNAARTLQCTHTSSHQQHYNRPHAQQPDNRPNADADLDSTGNQPVSRGMLLYHWMHSAWRITQGARSREYQVPSPFKAPLARSLSLPPVPCPPSCTLHPPATRYAQSLP